MIKYLRHTEIDKEIWDKRIKDSSNGHVFAYSWYLDIAAPGWDALVMGDYDIIMPLTHRKKFGFRYLFVSFFMQQVGVIFSGEKIPGIEDAFLDEASKRFSYLDIYLNSSNHISGKGYKIFPRKIQFLSLKDKYEVIANKFNRNLNRNLVNANSFNLYVKERIAASEVVSLFREKQGEKMQEFSENDYLILEKLIENASEKGNAENLGVYTGSGELCAVGSFLINNRRIIFFKCSSTDKGKEASAIHFLVNYMIEKYSGQDYIFDFGGSNIPNVARFNKNFGVQEEEYLHVRKNNLPIFLRWLKN